METQQNLKRVDLGHITFATAKLAHDKGLRLNHAYSNTWYNNEGTLIRLDHVDDYVGDHFHGPEGTNACIVRVTHDLLRDWLRVNHNIIVEVLLHNTSEIGYRARIWMRPNPNKNTSNLRSEVYNDYYRAYEAGLLMALQEIQQNGK